MKQKLLFLSIAVASVACSTQKTATTQRDHGANNVVSTTQTGSTTHAAAAEDEIIFKGNDNLFDMVQKNTHFFDQNHDVIIIEGSNNIIRLYNTNVLDLRGKGSDTLVIVGNKSKYVMDVNNQIALDNNKLTKATVKIEPQPLPLTLFEAEKTKLDEYQLQKLAETLASDNPELYYEMGQNFHYGHYDWPASSKKATE
ncbi:MAG: hypothetical protein LPK19_05970 [Hymenobacteraceae bacterium]|nr:hypothetical protein [Hymenobacteraceae bacterium]MDX5395747.1 hypothetical protein [Hymenobacteraceae bacterium]MDX5511801.1 hypothetical protein [Hymenobacteraceae bacterium]